jgi:hypothetical protein
MQISINYDCKWYLSGNEKYLLSTCGKVIDSEKKRECKKVTYGVIIGYRIGGKFISKDDLRLLWMKIPTKRQCPFGIKKY